MNYNDNIEDLKDNDEEDEEDEEEDKDIGKESLRVIFLCMTFIYDIIITGGTFLILK